MPPEGHSYSVNRSSRSASDAALKGASLAFAKQIPPKPAKPNTYSGKNGALAAATKVGPTNNRLQLHKEQPPIQLRPQSQSLLAANIAASRSPSVSPRHTGSQDTRPRAPFTQVSRRRSASALGRSSSVSSAASSAKAHAEEALRDHSHRRGSSKPKVRLDGEDELLDAQSIPSTNALIGFFEKGTPKKATSDDIRVNIPHTSPAKRAPPEIKSPKPIRPSGTFIPEENKLIKALSVRPEARPKPSALSSIQAANRDNVHGERRNEQDGHSSSDDSFVSASDHQEAAKSRHDMQTPATFRLLGQESEKSNSSIQRLPVRPPTKRTITPHMTGDSLANAIVASSLASSRAASPAKALNPPPVPAPRRHKHSFFSHHHEPHNKRTPSPVKGLKRHTMRKTPQSDNEEESSHRRGHKHLVKKHPHKHHEGDRKRWRDEITERERKRYLAVWASNKGVYTNNARVNNHASMDIPGTDLDAEAVCNLVVRDVFSRSRLGDDVLGEVYDLVNRDDSGGLAREEFVVGLWLIDQRLKGRKLPIKVSPSVWESVAGRSAWKAPRYRR